MEKEKAYNKLIAITKNQIEILKENGESDKFSYQIEMRQGMLKSFENRLKELS